MTSPALQLPRLAGRQTDYWTTVLIRTWRGTAITSFLMPFLYLTAMGVGLGTFVDSTSGERSLGGVTYLAFIAPGLLATTSMQTAVFESTYPVMAMFKWHRVYFSMAATPLGAADIVFAQLVFIAFRLLTACGVFVLVMAAFGTLHDWPGAVGALLVVVLLGLAYAAPIMGISSRLSNENGFSLIYRLGLMPMFLFSGAFFPISQLGKFAWLAYLTPIYHGVDLARMLAVGQVHGWAALGHLAYILLWLVAGWFYAVSGFHRKLST